MRIPNSGERKKAKGERKKAKGERKKVKGERKKVKGEGCGFGRHASINFVILSVAKYLIRAIAPDYISWKMTVIVPLMAAGA